jgi:hypothetical protein
MACAARRWPTFAELDRRLYSLYDIQALDGLREMPPGFLYGVGPNSSVPPSDSQEIGLTVAGVAACQSTGEILAVFVEFIQMAVAAEKAWQPPAGQPDELPSVTDAAFAARARNLPIAGRDHLLQLLFLIVKTESAGWAGMSHDPATGHWRVSFTRHIRDFAGVRDIGDYWSRRYKPWETRRVVPAVPAPAPAAQADIPPVPATVSYTFNAPVASSNFAVGGNAAQHAASDSQGCGSQNEPRGRDGDTVRAARIGGRYAIAASVIGAVLAAVLAAVLTKGFGLYRSHRSPPSPHSPSAIERKYDGKDPKGKNGPLCADPPPSQPVSQSSWPVTGPGGTVVGHVELRTSPICPVIWARVYWRNGSYTMPSGWSLHIVMRRRTDPATAAYVSDVTSAYVYGNMLATVRGCVFAQVYFAKGSRHTPSAVTGCLRST